MKNTPSLSMATHMFCHVAPVLISSVGGMVAEGAARAVGVLYLAFVSAWGAARWLTPSLDPEVGRQDADR